MGGARKVVACRLGVAVVDGREMRAAMGQGGSVYYRGCTIGYVGELRPLALRRLDPLIPHRMVRRGGLTPQFPQKERKKEIPYKEGNLKDIGSHVRYTVLYWRGGYLWGGRFY